MQEIDLLDLLDLVLDMEESGFEPQAKVKTGLAGILEVTKYIVSGRTTIVFFADGTKTTCTCCEEDTFDLVTGIKQCLLKRIFGNNVDSQIKSLIKAQERLEKQEQERLAAEKERKAIEERQRKKRAQKRLEKRARYEVALEAAKKAAKKSKAKKTLTE